MLKFGKKAEDILSIKKNFINENKNLFQWQKKLYKFYRSQPKRKFCKNCEKKLFGEIFYKLNIKYIICKICGHFNGENNDTKELSKKFYQTNEQKKYSTIYNEVNINSYINRVKKIYTPKVKFFFNVLKKYETKKKLKEMYYFDIGCGSGYYISALRKNGIKNLYGIDPSKIMVKYGNEINKFKSLKFIDHAQTINEIKQLNKDKEYCVSMIGSLEHIYNQNKIIRELKKNKKIKYLYIVVPCFSPSSIIELVFDKNFQRLLAPQHTHLYTYSSLQYFEKKFKLKIIGEWWFGADIIDLFRNFKISIKNRFSNYKIAEKMLDGLTDSLQLVIDKNKLSSEAHIVYKVN